MVDAESGWRAPREPTLASESTVVHNRKMATKAKEQINLDAGGRETENSKSISSFFRGIILFTLVWWVAIIFIYLNVRLS